MPSRLSVLVAFVAFFLSGEGLAQSSPGSSGPDSVVVDTTSRDSARAARPASDTVAPARYRLLLLPIHDSTGGLATLRQLLADGLVDQILHDSLDHGAIHALPDSIVVANEAQADSVGNATGSNAVVWIALRHPDSASVHLVAELRDPVRDSLLREVRLVLPDSGDQALGLLPRAILLGLFPRTVPPPPALGDSVKRVAILSFLPEGTATPGHAKAFSDSLATRLQGLDGFQVLPRGLRDSLLGDWDPGECLTASCRKEAGERLGVSWIVAGRLAQLGDKWTVHAELVRADSSALGREAKAQCLGAPAPSLKLVTGMTARQLAGKESPRPELSDAPIARPPSGPAWKRLVALGVASTLGLVGVLLSW